MQDRLGEAVAHNSAAAVAHSNAAVAADNSVVAVDGNTPLGAWGVVEVPPRNQL